MTSKGQSTYKNAEQLLGQACHDLANHLNAIAMQAEVAKLHLQQNDADLCLQALETVLQECREAGQLTGAAEQFARATDDPVMAAEVIKNLRD